MSTGECMGCGKLTVYRLHAENCSAVFTCIGALGVDKGGAGGPAPPPMAGLKRIFFVKIEGLPSFS